MKKNVGEISVSLKTGMCYFPKSVVERGYAGRIPFFAASTLMVLLNPTIEEREVEKELEILLKELRLSNALLTSRKHAKGENVGDRQ